MSEALVMTASGSSTESAANIRSVSDCRLKEQIDRWRH